jgi:hypothetical protein
MKKIEATTLEQAYAQAASEFGCSVTALQVEIVQFPSKGVLGLFKKSAIIIANLHHSLQYRQEKLKKLLRMKSVKSLLYPLSLKSWFWVMSFMNRRMILKKRGRWKGITINFQPKSVPMK